MATGLGSKMGAFVRRRPLLVTTVVGVTAASIYYKVGLLQLRAVESVLTVQYCTGYEPALFPSEKEPVWRSRRPVWVLLIIEVASQIVQSLPWFRA